MSFFHHHPKQARSRIGVREARRARVWVQVIRRELAETRVQLRPVVSPGVLAFWTTVARCETGVRWDWGRYHRSGEGSLYEGGVGFAASTWRAWASELGLLRRFPHAYNAPAVWQARVAEYGLRVHNGYWGCLQ